MKYPKSDFYNEEFINTDGNYVHQTAIIAPNVELGVGNVILPYTVIGYPGAIRELKDYQGKIKIGDNNFIGAHVSIMGGRKITLIGDDNIIMNKVNIGHDCSIMSRNEIGAGTVLSGYVFIGSDNKIKIGCVIRNRIEIENCNVIGCGSVVIKDIKSGEVWYGHPAEFKSKRI